MREKIETLRVFEKYQPNENYKTQISVKRFKPTDKIVFIEMSDFERTNSHNPKWRQKNWVSIDLEMEGLTELAKFFMELSAGKIK